MLAGETVLCVAAVWALGLGPARGGPGLKPRTRPAASRSLGAAGPSRSVRAARASLARAMPRPAPLCACAVVCSKVGERSLAPHILQS